MVPFDAGGHTIAASGPGQAFSRDVSISEKEEKRIEVVFSPVPVAPAPKVVAAPPAPSPPVTTSPGASATSSDSGTASNGPTTMGWVAVGAGGLALAGAAITAVLRQDSIGHIDETFPTHTHCPRSLEDSQTKARTFGALALALGAGGGALVVTGIVLVLTSGASSPRTTGAAATPWIGAHGAGVLGAMPWERGGSSPHTGSPSPRSR